MQESISDAMMGEMGKDDWLISDYVEIMQQSICDAMMDEMGKDKVGSTGWFLMSRWLFSKASATP